MRPRFSSRLEWQRTFNPLAAAESARRKAGDALLDLTESNPTTVNLGNGERGEALAEAFSHAPMATYAPAPRGLAAARRAVADAYAAAGTPIDPDRLVLTASSSESYSFLWKLLCDPGDGVLIPEPGYPLFDHLARLDGVTPLPYRLTHDATATGNWALDLDTIDDALHRAPGPIGALVVVSPNNPTGSLLKAADLAALDGRAAAARMALVADEVFADYVDTAAAPHVRCVAAQRTEALTFSLGGLSKGCGLPQMKLGWIAVGGPEKAADAALERLEIIADSYLSVGTPVQAALPSLLRLGTTTRSLITARINRNRGRLNAAIALDSPLTLLSSEGGWSAIVRVPAVYTDEEWALTLLEKDDVLVHPGYLFDLRGATFLVLSLLTVPEAFDEGVRRVVARVAHSIR